jgi:Ca2+-binding EF-hand superfamily protein
MDLLDDEDWFTPSAERVLTEIFEKFDVDKDGALNKNELDAFATATNGTPFDKETLQEIKDAFDVNEKEDLTKKGFFEMYHLQTLSEPKETWKDIKKHGYNKNLQKEE